MINLEPSTEPEQFDQVNHQGKTIQVGDRVLISRAGQQQEVTVSSIIKKQGHFWVGYDADTHFCPWPIVQMIENGV